MNGSSTADSLRLLPQGAATPLAQRGCRDKSRRGWIASVGDSGENPAEAASHQGGESIDMLKPPQIKAEAPSGRLQLRQLGLGQGSGKSSCLLDPCKKLASTIDFAQPICYSALTYLKG